MSAEFEVGVLAALFFIGAMLWVIHSALSRLVAAIEEKKE